MEIRRYELKPPAFHPWRPEFLEVATEVALYIKSRIPEIRVEHVGSTSVDYCGGKGIVDLLVLYFGQPGEFERVRDQVDAIGFQKQSGGHIFPEDRPMRVGAVQFKGIEYRFHIHVLQSGCKEERGLCEFRDDLRQDEERRASYIELKQQILQRRLSDPKDYTSRKSTFFDD
ncbi:MAG: GrpB family protein [Verrucomicrobiota bacterium]